MEDLLSEIVRCSDDISQCVFTKHDVVEQGRLKVQRFDPDEKNKASIVLANTVMIQGNHILSLETSKVNDVDQNVEQLEGLSVAELLDKLQSVVDAMDQTSDVTQETVRLRSLKTEYQSLHNTLKSLREKVRVRNSSKYVNERLIQQQEDEEKVWESSWNDSKNVIRELETSKNQVDLEIHGLDTKIRLLNDAVEQQPTSKIASREQKLRNEWAKVQSTRTLRLEEERDLNAALASLESERDRLCVVNQQQMQMQEKPSTLSNTFDDELSTHQARVDALQGQAHALRVQIMEAEEQRQEIYALDPELNRFQTMISTQESERAQKEALNEAARTQVNRIKDDMRKMVNLSSEKGNVLAILLQVLYECNGEVIMSELKEYAKAYMTKHHSKEVAQALLASSDAIAIQRGIYALVAAKLVQIDRSDSKQTVISLLVG